LLNDNGSKQLHYRPRQETQATRESGSGLYKGNEMKISKKILDNLIGQEIVKVCYEDEDNVPVIYLKNGTALVILKDPEGNGPGFVSIDGEFIQDGF
jgi:hypothetical protein